MSSSPNTDSSQSPSLLSNLRHFRFQKKQMAVSSEIINKPETEASGTGCSSSVLQSAGGSNSNVNSEQNQALPNSPNKREVTAMALGAMQDHFNYLDVDVLERALIKNNGDVAAAKIMVRNEVRLGLHRRKIVPKVPVTIVSSAVLDSISTPLINPVKPLETSKQTISNNCEVKIGEKRKSEDVVDKQNIKKARKERKRIAEVDESGDSDGDDADLGYNRQDNKVYDSDQDSDVEISDTMSVQQKEVFEFLCNATLGELLCMPNISQKKAEAIIEQRPFTGWKTMVEKFQEGKGLGTEILNAAQDVLYTRLVVQQLMHKCQRLAVEMERAIAVGATSVINQPSLLNPSLKLAGYQLVGLNWLLVIHNRGLNGILADEMGLGKTVQIISLLAYLKEKALKEQRKSGTHLIIVPSSTLDNWNNEINRWCPSLNVAVYYGSLEERKAMRIKFSQEGIEAYDAVLTTYKLITSTPEERKMYKVLPFFYVIFDEAHMLKNMKTQRFEQLMRVNAEHRLLLTGTPLQNNLLELMSLLTFVMPDMFAKKRESLKCLFTRAPKTTKETDSTKQTASRFEQEQVANAKRIMAPFVLRRLKKDVLKDLPIKTEDVLYCPMSVRQGERYKELIATFSKQTGARRDNSEHEIEVSGMTMMMDLRKLSNHPLLLREHYTDERISKMAKLLAKEPTYKVKNMAYIEEDLSLLSDFQLHTLAKTFTKLSEFLLEDEHIVQSGKFDQLDRLLPSLQQDNHRVLIFSQFVMMLDVMEEYLNIRGYRYLRLDGSTPVPIRQQLIDEYNSDPSILVFMLSTRAGGLGINLTAADTVIIHDIDFNPYNDKQAEDRCHRVGQQRPVKVTRLITKDSIEEGIYQVALDKLSLEKEISADENDHSESKSVVRLLKKTLGLDNCSRSPVKKPS